ncbi:rRNA maturation RNase YbeY [Helicovermis profundi]|uniref:Endoribonuclease YbeY n=1 Tax=Helicovermis profundi TaxID=3065157 RepID=A0AAU9EX46_9FIRM|nr:rRNA maturation RNase YbeY [Clostridia bacterium S502]
MVNLDIENSQSAYEIDEVMIKKLTETVEMAIWVEGLEEFNIEVSMNIVTNEMIKKLNKEYRNIDSVTDVLSFHQYDSIKDSDELDENLFLGDIVISAERAYAQSIEYNHSFLRELCYLAVHSMFHLFGYDHMNEIDKKEMRELEEETLKKLGINR